MAIRDEPAIQQSIAYVSYFQLVSSVSWPFNSDPALRMIMTALRSYSICNHTIGPISGSFFCLLAKSVQADKASWSVFILSVFPVTREALSLTKTATSPSVLTSYHFCKTCLKREIMIAATWRTCSSTWRMQRIELNGEEEPAWLTPYLRDPRPEGERDSD